MNDIERMPSAEFRRTYPKLDRPVVVTAAGRPIGTWVPTRLTIETSLADLDMRDHIASTPSAAMTPRERDAKARDVLRRASKA